jgi:hypothetical protein
MNLKSHYMLLASMFLCFFHLQSCLTDDGSNAKSLKSNSAVSKQDSIKIKVRKLITELTQDDIRKISTKNSCYLPLLSDSTFYNKKSQFGFDYNTLFNKELSTNQPYRNRYIVGDFNVLDDSLQSKGFEEINPLLHEMVDFKGIDKKIIDLLEINLQNDKQRVELLNELSQIKDTLQKRKLTNFIEKVWKYKTPALKRKFNVNNSKVYAAGQKICLCEAQKDTLIEVARFAISGKNYDPLPEGRGLVQYLPTGPRRAYYGDLYQITSKNWERERKYESIDIDHDKEVGGGNNQITFYKGKVELPNFLLMKPDEKYPKAVRQNGIHEVALRELARGMLGSSNSIGCIRVSAFASKFIRWWVPQSANFFILYQSDKYYKEIKELNAEDMIPFKTLEEGNKFRLWVNDNLPDVAKMFDLDKTGDFRNGYVLDVYNIYGDLYEKSKK